METFLVQTARDYDIPLHVVEKIYNLYPKEFYQKLEEFILERSKK